MIFSPTEYYLANMILRNSSEKGEDHAVFVYGTLKSGYGNNYLLQNSDYLGKARTIEKYALYQQGIPYVTKYESVVEIQGEVYLVDDETLGRLDQLEGHPNWYCREQTDVLMDAGKVVLAWIYFHPFPKGRLLSSGCY